MNSRSDLAGHLSLTAFWPHAGPWRVGIVSALVVGTIGSLSLIAAVMADTPGSRIYVAAIAIWINAIVIGYILGVARVVEGALQGDIDRLGPLLREDHDVVFRRLTATRNPRALLLVTLLGLCIGVLTSEDTLPRLLAGDREARLSAWMLLLLPLLWALILHVFWLMLDIAVGMYRLARDGLHVEFRHRPRLDAFASFGFRHLLLIVIGLAVIPVQAILTGAIEIWDFVPALSISIPVALLLLVLPIAGAHQTLVDAKRRELERIDVEAEAVPPDSDRALLLHLYRGETARASEWPVSVGGLARIVAYALVPPLAWTAAAVVEAWVSALIG